MIRHLIDQTRRKEMNYLEHILKYARHMEVLSKEVVTLLPEPVQPHCRVTTLNSTQLVLQADSSAWATRLYYHVPIVLDYFQEKYGFSFLEIKIHVNAEKPIPEEEQPVYQRRAVMSQASGEFLQSAANRCVNLELRAVLEKLARHGLENK